MRKGRMRHEEGRAIDTQPEWLSPFPPFPIESGIDEYAWGDSHAYRGRPTGTTAQGTSERNATMLASPKRIAQAAVTAGLAALMTLSGSLPAFADSNYKGKTDVPTVGESANPSYEASVGGQSSGDTKLYITGTQDDLTTSEGSTTEQIRVSIPVAIHYVANSEGDLIGPSDNVVKFVNHTKTGPVHVSKIKVDAAVGSDADISLNEDVADYNDRMSFFVQPVQGQSTEDGSAFVPASMFSNAEYVDGTLDGATAGTQYAAAISSGTQQGARDQYVTTGTLDELGYYSTTATGRNTQNEFLDPTHQNDWNIAQEQGALGLNSLTGKIGGFSKIDSATDYQAGVIHWVVRAGTRQNADTKDTTLTIHYNANNGNRNPEASGDNSLLKDQKTAILTYDAYTPGHDGGLSYNASVAQGAQLKSASSVIAPKQSTSSAGAVTTWAFAGWSLNPKYSTESGADNEGAILFVAGSNFTVDDVVQNAKAYSRTANLVNNDETNLSNGVLQLYAIYTSTTTPIV